MLPRLADPVPTHAGPGANWSADSGLAESPDHDLESCWCRQKFNHAVQLLSGDNDSFRRPFDVLYEKAQRIRVARGRADPSIITAMSASTPESTMEPQVRRCVRTSDWLSSGGWEAFVCAITQLELQVLE